MLWLCFRIFGGPKNARILVMIDCYWKAKHRVGGVPGNAGPYAIG